jgi:formamidopyrimidine-DNA glycosylase
MPELPEVETVRRGLLPLIGLRILRLILNRNDLRFPFPTDFDSIEGRRIIAIERRAKYLLIRLEGDLTWLVHLGMTGRFGHEEEKHSHVIVSFEGGERLVYTDPRRFGIMDLIRTGENHKLLSQLGPEPLSAEWSAADLHDSLSGRRISMKSALLNGRIVAGIGNIYASEILFRACVSPRRLACNLSKAKAERLHAATRSILSAAIEAGGSTLSDGQFRNVEGDLGYFPHEFAVYDRAGLDCESEDCDSGIKRIIQQGRSTFFCSRCQR